MYLEFLEFYPNLGVYPEVFHETGKDFYGIFLNVLDSYHIINYLISIKSTKLLKNYLT